MRFTLLLSGLGLLLAGCDQTARTAAPATSSKAESAASTETTAPTPTSPEPEASTSAQPDAAEPGEAASGGRIAGRHAPARPAPAMSVPNPSPDSPRLAFDTPDGWVAQEPTSKMRQAQYLLPVEDGAPLELAVFFLGGSIDNNITRWQSQFKDADGQPIAAEASTAQPLEADGLNGTMVTIRGRYNAPVFMGGGQIEDATMLGAGIEGDERGNWYIRVVGPTEAIDQHKDAFEAFLKSARPAE